MSGRDLVEEFNARADAEGWDQRCDPGLAFRREDFRRLLSVWDKQRGPRALPTRADMTARVLKPFLPRIALTERVAQDPPRYRWRIVGTQVAQVLGERTGTFIEDNASPRQAARLNAANELVLALSKPLRFVGRVLTEDKDFMTGEVLFLPLAGDDGLPRFVMGFGHYTAEMSWRDALKPAP